LIRSMTGFGQGEARSDEYSVQIEVKSVNHRYLDLFFRIPRQYSPLEEAMRSEIAGRIARGRVEVMLTVEEFGNKERIVHINDGLLQAYLQAIAAVKGEMGSEEVPSLSLILSLPGLLEVDEPPLDFEELQRITLEAMGFALDGVERMRVAEGRRLSADLQDKVEQLEQLCLQLAKLAPQVVEDYRGRLRERLEELLDGTTITEERFLGEVAIFADRASIDEELVRMASHLQQFRETLQTKEPVGRKLDFLVQEMNREVNTIGSKGNNVHIAGHVVTMKSVLEKIREQIQNIE
jgi:uncharacterized protein (TIGR00255 family)